MGEKKINQEEPIYLRVYDGINKFKSIRGAIRRGNVTIWGVVVSKRPFNNKKRTLGKI